jgi:hypothetical protein
MDDLLLLGILNEIAKLGQKSDKIFLRALLSNLVGEKLDESAFRNIASKLVERGYAAVVDDSYSITPEGTTIASTLLPRFLKEDDIRLISTIVQTYSVGPPSRRIEITRQLVLDVEERILYAGKKLQKIDAQNLIANCILASFKFTIPAIYVSILVADIFKTLTDSSDRYRLLAKLEHQVEKELSTWSVSKLVDNNIFITTPRPIKTIEQPPYPIEIVSSESKSPGTVSDIERITKAIIQDAIHEMLRRLGYVRVGRSFSFVNYNLMEKERSKIGVIRYFQGYKIGVDIIRNGQTFQVFLWIDPIHKMIYTLFDYIEFLHSEGVREEEILNYLSKIKTIHVMPYDSIGSVESIETFSGDVSHERVPDVDKTYFEFWKERHGIELREKSQALVKVRLGNQVFSYPSETLYIDKVDIDKKIGTAKELMPRTLSPTQRIDRLTSFITKAFGHDTVNEGYELKFQPQPQLVSWESLITQGYCIGAWRISPPTLQFNHENQRDELTSDPRALFKYGPESSRKDIHVLSLMVPQHFRDIDVNLFKDELNAAFNRHNFGRLSFDKTTITRISEGIEESRLSKIIDLMPEGSDSNELAIVVLPLAERKLYLKVKKMIFDARKVPTQIIMENTFRRTIEGDYGVTRNIVLQIYTKLLKRNEAVWVLKEPCDGNLSTLFIGIGFSATPFEHKRANSFAALCDARGRELDWEPIGIPFSDKRYIETNWFSGFLEYLYDKIRSRPNIKRVVVYRKGDTYENEISAILTVLKEQQTKFLPRLDFVSIKSDMIRIFQRSSAWSNPESGILLQLRDGSALMAISSQRGVEMKQGTVCLVRIKRVVGSSDILSIANEYHDLAYLNWTAPITISKFPIVVNLAHKIAEKMKDLRDDGIFKFFPS